MLNNLSRVDRVNQHDISSPMLFLKTRNTHKFTLKSYKSIANKIILSIHTYLLSSHAPDKHDHWLHALPENCADVTVR